MKRYCLVICVIALWGGFLSTVQAEGTYDVTVRVLDEQYAELELTYPVSRSMRVVTGLSSKKDGVFLDGYRELVSAHAQDGSARSISHNTPTTDSQVGVQSGDTHITLVYRLTNILRTTDVSLFNFLLFFGKEYPTTARIHLKIPSGYEIISHSGQKNVPAMSDGSVTTEIYGDQADSLLSAKNLTVLVYPKTTSPYIRKDVNNFTLIGNGGKVTQLATSIRNISFAPEMFRKILDVSLPENIVAVVTAPGNSSRSYEPSGIALFPNIILIDPGEIDFSKGPYDVEKLMIHELGHLALAQKGIFNHQPYNARWFDEGIAVFSEQYATDNYLIKDQSARQKDTVLSRFRKMTLVELATEYELMFDYNFTLNNPPQSIDRTYAHAGLIFYHLYLRDTTLVARIINSLKTARSNVTCKECDTDTIFSIAQSITGLKRNEMIYPFKNDLSAGNSILSRLVVDSVDESTRDKIKSGEVERIGSYIDSDATVEEFTNPGSEKKIKTNVQSTATEESAVPQKVKEESEDNSLIAPVSFFERVKNWFKNLF